MCSTGPVVVIGAGPAGLTAAYLLARQGIKVTVVETDPKYVGGISRTAKYKGFHFDIGGHRFFTKSERVERFWREILPNDFLTRPRSSRIYYRGRFFSYPLRAFEALTKLGLVESVVCICSYIKAKLFPIPEVKSFEDWVVNQFGRRLFSIFFRSYTEKVWGIKCNEISSDWAAQRIKGLSLGKAIVHALVPKHFAKAGPGKKDTIKSLIQSFQYPRKGPGMMWEACADKVRTMGGTIHLGCRVVSTVYRERAPRWQVVYESSEMGNCVLDAESVISSAPLRELSAMLEPSMSSKGRGAAAGLKYRDFLTVMLILKERNRFPDNWIYIHDPKVKVGRIQNFKSWSPEMVPDPDCACYGLEYFCFEGDGLWNSSDYDLIELATREMEQLGLAEASEVVDGCVVRQPKAYPVYDDGYTACVREVRLEIEKNYPGLYLVGRNGMHKYNNQDHAMMTAMLTVENLIAGKRLYDVWAVNQDAEYIEGGASGERAHPERIRERK